MRRPSSAVQVLLVKIVLLVLCTLLLTTLVQAQYRTSIQGTVTDPTGAVVSGATLTLTNPATGEKWVRTTNDAGVYNFNALAAAPFRLEVDKTGFKKKVLDHVTLIPEQPNALDVQLQLGSENQTVTVNADTIPAIDTETASINGVVSSNQIQHMPSFGRDVMQLIQLAPGIFGDGAQGANGDGENLPGMQGPGSTGGNNGIFQTENGAAALAVGQQYETNQISIDGISTTSAVWGGTTVITPTEDSIDNVKVLSNGYDAEYGRFSGAQIQITSKGGTNDIHGSLFFLAHRPNWNAYQRFNGLGNNVTRDDNFFDQFGGSVGGPLWKNKIFAFFAYETVRTPPSVPSVSPGWYDTPAFDALAPSGSIAAKYLTFPGSGVINKGINNATCADAGLIENVNCVTIPGQGLNLGTPLAAPLGTQDLGWASPSSPGTGGDGTGGPQNLGTTADIANYITVSNSTSSKAQYNGRLDADVTGKDRLGFAIYWVPQSSSFLNGPARQYNFFHHSQVNDAFSLIWNHTFSPTLLNELRVNAAGWRWNEVTSNPQSPVGLPSDTIGQIGNLTGSSNINQFGPNVGSILNQWTYSYKDVATKIYGRHTIKFGGEVTRLFYLQDCAGCGVPSYSFFNMWDFLNDAPHSESSSFNPGTGAPTTIRQDQRENIWGIFVQDDLKVRPNLTLNLGLRYNYFGSLSSKQNNMFRAIPGAGPAYLTGLAVRKDNSWDPEKDDFGPEIGFAWSPSLANNKLVFRGGYGLSYNQEEIAISANISNNPGLVVSPTFSMSGPASPNPGIIYATSSGIHDLYGYPANPNAISTFNSNGLPSSGAAVNISLFPQTLPTTLVHHYSFDMQYDVGHQFVASLGYMGTLSRNIYFHQNPNATPAALGLTLNPQIGGGDYWGVNGHANYNAMLATVKHQFSHQFMADAEFTWAKSMDTSSGPYYEQPYPYAPNLNYGRSDYDVAKAFKLYGVWQPVIFRGANGWLEKIVGGWSLSGIFNWHSGFPWSPVVSVTNPVLTDQGGSLYCDTCGYTTLFPAAYLGGAGSSTSNDQFKTGSNYSKGALSYFTFPTYTAYTGNTTPAYGNALPQIGLQRNYLNGPGYRDVDATLAKGFGLPKAPVLGEGAKVEIRLDFYNLFNTVNFNPTSISNNIGCQFIQGTPTDPGPCPTNPGISNPSFGRATAALAGRVMTLGARFSF